MNRKFAFVFICQAGDLELKSSVLAASLRKYLVCECELIAAIPGPAETFGSPHPQTLEFLQSLGVRIVSIKNEFDPTYGLANKFDCLRIQTDADKLVFLDSDMLLMREFADDARFDIAFSARPASSSTFSPRDSDYHEVCKICDTAVPTLRIRTTYTNEYVLPYFNSAFIAVPPDGRVGDMWLECAQKIESSGFMRNNRYFLEQTALSIAVMKLGLEIDCLNERFNHPINFKPMNERDLPFFCHYHDPQTLMREPAAVRLARTLLLKNPALKNICGRFPAYAPLLRESPNIKKSGPASITPELIITGIHRSGTSYLCNLLHRLDNCVILNEPVEAPAALMEANLPWGVARHFRNVRRDVLAGTPIKNKLADGKVTQDTAVAGEVGEYFPQITGEDFILGMKATVAFLSRISSASCGVAQRPLRRLRAIHCTRSARGKLPSRTCAMSISTSSMSVAQTIPGSQAGRGWNFPKSPLLPTHPCAAPPGGVIRPD